MSMLFLCPFYNFVFCYWAVQLRHGTVTLFQVDSLAVHACGDSGTGVCGVQAFKARWAKILGPGLHGTTSAPGPGGLASLLWAVAPMSEVWACADHGARVYRLRPHGRWDTAVAQNQGCQVAAMSETPQPEWWSGPKKSINCNSGPRVNTINSSSGLGNGKAPGY